MSNETLFLTHALNLVTVRAANKIKEALDVMLRVHAYYYRVLSKSDEDKNTHFQQTVNSYHRFSCTSS